MIHLPSNPPELQFAQIDDKLSILRESWMEAPPKRKSYWMGKINVLLDERSALTKLQKTYTTPIPEL